MFNPIQKLRNWIAQARRVLLVAAKPDPEEFKISVKITALGIVLIGLLGFIIFIVFNLISSAVGGI
jgi:protein transport protein SEC61 subunit gamma-like protein